MDRITRRSIEERVITIDEVNMNNLFVVALDQYGSRIQISMHLTDGGITTVPAKGEIWTAKRHGNEWFLAKRADSGTEATLITSLQPGDKRIEASGSLYINADDVRINGVSYRNDVYGTLEIAVGDISATVGHGLGTIPSFIHLTPITDTQGVRWWLSFLDETLFTIQVNTAPVTNPIDFNWIATS